MENNSIASSRSFKFATSDLSADKIAKLVNLIHSNTDVAIMWNRAEVRFERASSGHSIVKALESLIKESTDRSEKFALSLLINVCK